MSNKAMSWAIDCRVHRSHKLVLMLLADAHNGHSGACFPSQAWIMEKGGLGESTVQNCLKDLEEWGLLKRETSRLGRGKGSRTDYVLNLEKLDPSNIDLYKSGLTPLKTDHLDPQIQGVSIDEPEREPEGTGNLRALADKIWELSPTSARKRSSKAKVETAAKRAVQKGVDPDQLIAAWLSYLEEPDVRKQDHAFAKGPHSWINDGRYGAFITTAIDMLTYKSEPGRNDTLAHAFSVLADHGQWLGDRYGFPTDPRHPSATYPEELYTQFKITKREAA